MSSHTIPSRRPAVRRGILPGLAFALLLVLVACGPAWADAAPPRPGGTGADADTVDLRALGYDLGPRDAPVVVVEFSDFGCAFCAMFAQGTFPTLAAEFVETGRVRWKYVPFVLGMFPNAAEAARAAECAGEQDAFWPMREALYRRQREWRGADRPERVFAGLAGELELDMARFRSCYRSRRTDARTRANGEAARALWIRATPSFLINGRRIEGALPLEQFRRLLSEAAAIR